jgi:hypothetical protein
LNKIDRKKKNNSKQQQGTAVEEEFELSKRMNLMRKMLNRNPDLRRTLQR